MSEWQDIASAPRDGTGMLLTDGRFVHYGWWRGEGSHPWAMVDSHDTDPHGCCDNEAEDTVQLNGWTESGPTHWMVMPDVPARLTSGGGNE